jgi:hypothetical protein
MQSGQQLNKAMRKPSDCACAEAGQKYTLPI